MQNLLKQKLGKNRVKLNIDIDSFMTMKMNVKAQYVYEASTREELVMAIKTAAVHKIPFYLLGGGSNVIFFKERFEGLLIINKYLEGRILKETSGTTYYFVSSGYPVSLLINKTVEAGLEGFEYFKGMPGTVGGALYMNAKWTKPLVYFGDRLLEATIVDLEGNVRNVDKNYFQFAYDSSILHKTHEIVLDVVFQLSKINPEILRRRSKMALDYRKRTQPHGVATAGCFFKNLKEEERERLNIPTTSAGYLIDACGLKGLCSGSFCISPIHANFIVNTMKSSSQPQELFKLIDIVKQAVRKKYKIELEEEVIRIEDGRAKNN